MPGTLYPEHTTPDYRGKELACEHPRRHPSLLQAAAYIEEELSVPLEAKSCAPVCTEVP